MRYSSGEQQISFFVQREVEGNLRLRPAFQRRPVWTLKQKSNFIDSILRQLPIPEIYLQTQTSPDGMTLYVVVDGQQRIGTILEFVGVGGREGFELSHLNGTSPWDGYAWQDLSDDERTKFHSHALAVRSLIDASDDDVKDLFRRLNKYLTPLNAQELRNATYGGPFIKLAETLADDPYWAENRIVEAQAIRRMRDIEFVSDLLIGVMNGPQSGNSRTLDDYYEQYEEYEDQFREQAVVRRLFNKTVDAIQSIFPNIKNTRWRNRGDYYSLFVALGSFIRGRYTSDTVLESVRQELNTFEEEIGIWRDNENARVRPQVPTYVRALQRGSSDRTRRAARHRALIDILSQHFGERS